MFGKLVKHEFRATARIIPFIFLISFVVSSATLVLVYNNLKILSSTAVLLILILGGAQTYIVLALVLWRYYKSMYGHQAYLTHTLPVNPSSHYWSKILVGSFWIIISYFVLFAVMICAFYSLFHIDQGQFPVFSDFWSKFLREMGMVGRGPILLLVLFLTFFIHIVFSLIQYLFSISLGSVSKLHRLGIGGPILIYIVQYLVVQALFIGAMVSIPAGFEFFIDESGELGVQMFSGSMLSSIESEMSFDVIFFSETLSITTDSPNPVVDNVLFGIDLGSILLTPIIAFSMIYLTIWLIRKHTSLR